MQRTIEKMAQSMREAYAGDLLSGMRGPARLFAEQVEVRYVPPRATDGWHDGAMLYDYQEAEAATLRSVVPDAHLEDVQVITRAEDQIIVVMVMAGTMKNGAPYRLPATLIYDVRGDKIVRVIGLYDQAQLAAFADAFEEAARTRTMPIEMAPPRPRDGQPCG